MEDQKKVFDPTMKFSMFGDWVAAIEELETETDRDSKAYMLFKSIADYALFSIEPDFANNEASRSLKPFWYMIEPQIDSSRNNSERHYKKEPDKIQSQIIDMLAQEVGISDREVAKRLGVDKNRVNRTHKRFQGEIDRRVSESVSAGVVSRDFVFDSSGNSSRDCAFDSYSICNCSSAGHDGTDMGRCGTDMGHNGTAGHYDLSASGDDISPEERATIFERLNEAYRNQSENTNILSDAVRQWQGKYHSRYRQITNGGAFPKVAFIMERYLADHEETPLEKKYGEKYGRYIIGWDDEKLEPIIGYALSYLPNAMMKHNITDVPNWYIVHDKERRKELKEQWMIERGLLVPDNEWEGELPF